MKRGMIIFTIISGLSVQAFSGDQNSQAALQATMSLTGAVTSYATGASLLNTTEPTAITKVLGASAIVAGTGQLGVGIASIAMKDKLQKNENIGVSSVDDGRDLKGGLPSGPSHASPKPAGFSNPSYNSDLNKLRETALAKKTEGEAKAKEIFGDDISLEDMANHPENYLTSEEMKEYDKEKGKMKKEMESKNSEDALKNLSELPELDASTNTFDPMLSGFNFDDLFSQMNGLNNPVEGYYGNIKVGLLKPESKQSLFERVSHRIKKLM